MLIALGVVLWSVIGAVMFMIAAIEEGWDSDGGKMSNTQAWLLFLIAGPGVWTAAVVFGLASLILGNKPGRRS